MSLGQKIGRILVVSGSLFAICFLTALVGTLGIFFVDLGNPQVSTSPELLKGLEIVLASIGGNTICVVVLLEIRKADLRLHLHPSEHLFELN